MDWGDPQTLWLNVANALLGVAVLGAVGVLLVAFIRDLLHRR